MLSKQLFLSYHFDIHYNGFRNCCCLLLLFSFIFQKYVSQNSIVVSASPSTPKQPSKHNVDDNMFATPTSHHIQDDDSDSSPYCLSFSQRAMGVEVITWDEKSRATPFKSKKSYEKRDTESPPTRSYVDVEPVASESPKGLFKFLLGWERRQVATQIEDDFERIDNETTSAQNANNTTSNNETIFCNATEQVEATQSRISNSPNLKHLLNDSEDMDLILCSQRIEQEEFSRNAPVIQNIVTSKGFSEIFSDDDGKMFLTVSIDESIINDPFSTNR